MMKIDSYRGNLWCVYCRMRRYIIGSKGLNDLNPQLIPINPTADAMLDYIFNKDGNIIGLECPTCKRKIFFVSQVLMIRNEKKNKKVI